MLRRLRRSMLFVPGNSPALIIDAPIFAPDSIILDLEDAVAVDQKDAARELVVSALKTLDFGPCEVCVRINAPTPPSSPRTYARLPRRDRTRCAWPWSSPRQTSPVWTNS